MAALRFIGTLSCQILTANRVALPPINLSPVADSDHRHDHFPFFDSSNRAVVADTITPIAVIVPRHRTTPVVRIAALDDLDKRRNNAVADMIGDLAQHLARLGVELKRPDQVQPSFPPA